MVALYSEWDAYAAEWLGNLVSDGEIAPGVVDTRSVTDIQPWELMLHTQCHFYAGIGGWSAALRLAGWPDDREIWSMSLPCQPFSSAGQRKGFDDDRHLWPVSYAHILACRPRVVVGEQVASTDGRAWLDNVQTDMEAAGYAFWAVVLPVAGFGCPGERHRIFWLAYAAPVGRGEGGGRRDGAEGQSAGSVSGGASQWVVGVDHPRPQGHSRDVLHGGQPRWIDPQTDGPAVDGGDGLYGLADATDSGHDRSGALGQRRSEDSDRRAYDRPGPLNGWWRDADWLFCTDSRWRPTQPGYEPLAYGLPRSLGALSPGVARHAMVAGCDADSLKRAKRYRVGSLRGYGNAINLQVAAEWIKVWKDDLP